MAAKEAPKAEEEAAFSEVSCILLNEYTVNHGQIRKGNNQMQTLKTKCKGRIQSPLTSLDFVAT